MESYVLRQAEAAADRLAMLARVTWPSTSRALERAGLRPGMRCLDAGCGGGLVSLELARIVGPAGSVVGIDMDETGVERAGREAEARGLPAAFRVADVHVLEEEGEFDLVFARFLLSHLPKPEVALARMVRALRPGGVVVLEDVDFGGHVCHPPCAAFDRYVELYRAAVRRRGADPEIGPRLPGMLEDAGAAEVEFEALQLVYREGEGKLLAPVTMEHIREAVAGSGLASHEEIDRTVRDLDAHARDRSTIMSLPRIFQAIGRAGRR